MLIKVNEKTPRDPVEVATEKIMRESRRPEDGKWMISDQPWLQMRDTEYFNWEQVFGGNNANSERSCCT